MAEAAIWGLVAGSGCVLGALIGHYGRPGPKVVGVTMGFGSGVLVSVLAFDLMLEASHVGGHLASIIGFIAGALMFSVADFFVDRLGGEHRKCHRGRQEQGSGFALWIGAVLDGIPESIVVGLSLLGGGVSVPVVAGIFLSNFPEGLSGASGMTRARLPRWYVLGLWASVALLTTVGSLLGFSVFQGMAAATIAIAMAVAAGAILAMLADTMMPEAFHLTGNWVALATVAGFITAFCISRPA